MKVLHILRKEPDAAIEKIIELHKTGNEVKVVELYKGGANYKELIDLIFKYDRVISW